MVLVHAAHFVFIYFGPTTDLLEAPTFVHLKVYTKNSAKGRARKYQTLIKLFKRRINNEQTMFAARLVATVRAVSTTKPSSARRNFMMAKAALL
jgi:hypothetical protein